MKQFHKIITLFIFILITGIFITIININAPLNSNISPEFNKIQKDSISFKELNTKTI